MVVYKQRLWCSKADNNPALAHSGILENYSFIYGKDKKNKIKLTPPIFTIINSNKPYLNNKHYFTKNLTNKDNLNHATDYKHLNFNFGTGDNRNEWCVGSVVNKKGRNDHSFGSKLLIPRILKTLSLVYIVRYMNSFCLALDSAQPTTVSVPPAVSLLQSEHAATLSSNNTLSAINSLGGNAAKTSLESFEQRETEVALHDNRMASKNPNRSSRANLMEMSRRLTLNPLSKIASFIQLSLSSGSTLRSRAANSKDKKKRSGGNRRHSKKKNRDEPEEKKTIWTEYMDKFDIAKVHGSGVYVDLGGSATVGYYDYRMPTGKCPVVGKAIVLENGADFLKSITHHDPKERGLAFPATKVSTNSSKADMDNQMLSPISAQVLRSWNYKHESDLSNCAEYSKNIIPGSSRDSKYRYPFVYDQADKLCYILYSPMQYNQGVKYCDTDSADEGTSSLACMYPDKDKEDSHLFYGTSALHMDWNVVCPVYPIKDAIFGAFDAETDECNAIEPLYEEDAEDYAACSKILFEYSPSDVDVSSNNQTLSDVDSYREAMESGKLSTALSIMFSPRYSEDRPIYTKGVGINWATYSVEDKKCRILDEIPSCLVISNGNYALTSLSSPNEEDAVPYPCDIKHGRGYVKNKKKPAEKPKEEKEEKKKEKKEEKEGEKDEKNKKAATTPAEEFIPYTSLKTDGFVCDRYVHTILNDSCGTYLECNTTPPVKVGRGKLVLVWVMIALAALAVLGVGGFFLYRHFQSKRFKRYESYDFDEGNEYYDSEHEFNNGYGGGGGARPDSQFNVNHEEGLWSRNEPHNSDVTPVRISRIERHN